MGLSFSGNFGALRQLSRKLRDAPRALEAFAKDGCEETLNLIGEGFKAGTDPYGRSWDAPNNLKIKGRIRSYARSSVSAQGWEVHATDGKAIWHHAPRPRAAWGGKALPTRLQVPIAGRGMPAKWRARFIDLADEHLEDWLNG